MAAAYRRLDCIHEPDGQAGFQQGHGGGREPDGTGDNQYVGIGQEAHVGGATG